jgi:hypothetical protein
MARHPHHGDEQALRLMRTLGELDAWNDAHDGAGCWYGVVRASYRRRELSRRAWAAYRAAYVAAPPAHAATAAEACTATAVAAAAARDPSRAA